MDRFEATTDGQTSGRDAAGVASGDPVLEGRTAHLGKAGQKTLVGVASGAGPDTANLTFAVSADGMLCQFSSRRSLSKWVSLKSPLASGLSVSANYVAVACANGVVRLFEPVSLEYVTTLPRPHPLGPAVNTAPDVSYPAAPREGLVYPDATCVRLSPITTASEVEATSGERIPQHVTVAYSDNSMYVWDINNVRKIGKYRSTLAHAAAVWDLEVVDEQRAAATGLPPGMFALGFVGILAGGVQRGRGRRAGWLFVWCLFLFVCFFVPATQ